MYGCGEIKSILTSLPIRITWIWPLFIIGLFTSGTLPGHWEEINSFIYLSSDIFILFTEPILHGRNYEILKRQCSINQHFCPQVAHILVSGKYNSPSLPSERLTDLQRGTSACDKKWVVYLCHDVSTGLGEKVGPIWRHRKWLCEVRSFSWVLRGGCSIGGGLVVRRHLRERA